MARRREKGAGTPAPRLRIVAGELGGRRLRSPPQDGADIRPTAERTREAIFSMIGPDAVAGAAVLDLFCGSGALGLEALSRGAAGLTLVDRRIETAAANVADLGLEDRARLIDAKLPPAIEPGGALAGGSYDLIFCDPPYRLAPLIGPALEQPLADLLAPGGLLIVESAAAEPMRLSLPLRRERTYGAAHVGIYAGMKD
jgi:16S rRNA (guanine966-N2)-methyltransferase